LGDLIKNMIGRPKKLIRQVYRLRLQSRTVRAAAKIGQKHGVPLAALIEQLLQDFCKQYRRTHGRRKKKET